MSPNKGSIAVSLFEHLYPNSVRGTVTTHAYRNGSLVICGYIEVNHPVIAVIRRSRQVNARPDLLHVGPVERLEEPFAQSFDVRFLAGPESEEELPLRHRVGQAGQLQSFIPGHEMTCQLKRVAFFLNQLDVDADFISAMDGDQQPVTAVGQAEIQVLRGWRVEKRFPMFTITVADRADVDLQVSAKRLPEQIMGDEKIMPCGLHLEPRRTDLFLGREAARRFRHEMGVFTEAKRMYENF